MSDVVDERIAKGKNKIATKYQVEIRERCALLLSINQGRKYDLDETLDAAEGDEFHATEGEYQMSAPGRSRNVQLKVSTFAEFEIVLKFFFDCWSPYATHYRHCQLLAALTVDSRAHTHRWSRFNCGVVIARASELWLKFCRPGFEARCFVAAPVDHQLNTISFTGTPTDRLKSLLIGEKEWPHLEIVCGQYDSRENFRNFEVKMMDGPESPPFRVLNLHLNYEDPSEYDELLVVGEAVAKARQLFVV
jgi:hypothetical protein